jgi:hypothetical protein
MKKLVFAITGAASLALAACNSGNQDTVNNAEMNQPSTDDLNQMANDAAMDAANAEAAALGAQQQQLENENASAADNATNPTDDQEQNVSGM